MSGPALREAMVDVEHRWGTVPVLVVEPEDAGPRPAVVVGAEAYGLNAATRSLAHRLATEGYAVLVPDYYRGKGLQRPDDYSDFTEVIGFIERLDFVQGTHDLLAAVDHARMMPSVDRDRVLVWGYCTGATLALMAACLDRHLAGGVLFFPSQPFFEALTPARPVHPVDLLWNAACPLLLLYGDQDPVMVPAMAEVQRRFDEWAVRNEVRVYPGAGHAFTTADPALHHEAADTASWRDATSFAARMIGS